MPLLRTVEDAAEVKLSANLVVSRVRDKRTAFTTCTWLERVLLDNAINSAQTYASKSYSYIRGMPRDSRRYLRYWSQGRYRNPLPEDQ